MVRIFVFLLLTGLLPAPLGAVPDTPGEAPPSYLFEINHPGRPASYLFGTIHLPDPRVTRLKPDVVEAFDQADAVYCELDMDAGAMAASAVAMMLPPSETLADILTEKQIARLDAELKRINPQLSMAPFMRLKVWAMFATLVLLESQMENPTVKPMDVALYRLASAYDKRTGGVETVQEQIGVFDQFSRAEQIEMLEATLDFMDELRAEGRRYTDELVEAYNTGDLQRIEQLMQAYRDEDNPALQDKMERLLIYDRNALMAERIAEAIETHPDETIFFAVGVAHLYGEKGVPALLRQRGFTVRQSGVDRAE